MEWLDFLAGLRQYRPRAPLNGVIVAIPCDALATDGPRRRARKAAELSVALADVQERLGVRLPVTVLLTKADRLPGFREFFACLPTDARRQMFGWSRPDSLRRRRKKFVAEEAVDATCLMAQRLRLLSPSALERPGLSPGSPEADRILAFPDEIDALQQPLAEYLAAMFAPGGYDVDVRPELRGFCFTSAMQGDETLNGYLSSMFKAQQADSGEDLHQMTEHENTGVPAEPSRDAYFRGSLYRDKVLHEVGLIAPTGRARQVRRRLTMLARAAVLVVGVVGMAALGRDLTRILAADDEIREQVLAKIDTQAEHGTNRDAHHDAVRLLLDGTATDDDALGIVSQLSTGRYMPTGVLLPVASDYQTSLAQPLFNLAGQLIFTQEATTIGKVVDRLNERELKDVVEPRDYLAHENTTLAAALLSGDPINLMTEGRRVYELDEVGEWFEALADEVKHASEDGASVRLATRMQAWGNTLAANRALLPRDFAQEANKNWDVQDAWQVMYARWRAMSKPTADQLGWPSPIGTMSEALAGYQWDSIKGIIANLDDDEGRLDELLAAFQSVHEKDNKASTDDPSVSGHGFSEKTSEQTHYARLAFWDQAHTITGEPSELDDVPENNKDLSESARQKYNETLYKKLIKDADAWAFKPYVDGNTPTKGDGVRAFWLADTQIAIQPSEALQQAFEDLKQLHTLESFDASSGKLEEDPRYNKVQELLSRKFPSAGRTSFTPLLEWLTPTAGAANSVRPLPNRLKEALFELKVLQELATDESLKGKVFDSEEALREGAKRAWFSTSPPVEFEDLKKIDRSSIKDALRDSCQIAAFLKDDESGEADIAVLVQKREAAWTALDNLHGRALDVGDFDDLASKLTLSVARHGNQYVSDFDQRVLLPEAELQIDAAIDRWIGEIRKAKPEDARHLAQMLADGHNKKLVQTSAALRVVADQMNKDDQDSDTRMLLRDAAYNRVEPRRSAIQAAAALADWSEWLQRLSEEEMPHKVGVRCELDSKLLTDISFSFIQLDGTKDTINQTHGSELTRPVASFRGDNEILKITPKPIDVTEQTHEGVRGSLASLLAAKMRKVNDDVLITLPLDEECSANLTLVLPEKLKEVPIMNLQIVLETASKVNVASEVQ